MSWKPEFKVDGVWYDNAMRYPTEAEAQAAADDKFMVWTVPTDKRAVESDDEPNYNYIDGRNVAVEKEEED